VATTLSIHSTNQLPAGYLSRRCGLLFSKIIITGYGKEPYCQ
jgi:hypothetical protein